MNKVYKVIWSKVRNCYVVVSELAKRNGKCSSSLNKKIIAAFLAAGMTMAATVSVEASAVGVDPNSTAKKGNASGTNSVAVGDHENTVKISRTVKKPGTTTNINTSTQPGAYGKYDIAIGKAAAHGERASATTGAGTNDDTDIGGYFTMAANANANSYVGGAIAVGHDALAVRQYAIALGTLSMAGGQDAIALGRNARAMTQGSIAIGSGEAGQQGIQQNYGINTPKDTPDRGGYSITIGSGANNFTYGYDNTDDYYANSKNSIAIGYRAHTHAANAFAIGISTDATAERSFAIGNSSTSNKNTASHQGASARGQGSIVFGDTAIVRGEILATVNTKDEERATHTSVNDAIAIGTNTLTQARNAVTLGGGMSYTYHDVSGNTMINKTQYYNGSGWVNDRAEGSGAKVGLKADGAIAIGGATGTVVGIDSEYFPTAKLTGTISDYTAAASIGKDATRAVAIGSGAVIGDNAVNSVAVGARNIVSGVNSTAVGSGDDTSANKVSAYASGSFGNKNLIGKQQVDAEGNLLPDDSTTNVFVVGGDNEIANASGSATSIGVFGSTNKVEGSDSTNSTMIGNSNTVTNKLTNSLVAGNSNTGLDTVTNSQIIGNSNTSIGANVSNLVVLGNSTTATGGISSVIAIGQGTTIGANNAIAMGSSSKAQSESSIAIGDAAQTAADKANATAIGKGANAKEADSVALGSSSVADHGPATTAGYDVITNTSYAGSGANSPTWTSTLAAVSVGDVANDKTRQITSVAAGYEDTDAVNVAQLKVASALETDNRNIGLTVNADGRREITSPYIHVEGVEDATAAFESAVNTYLASSEYIGLPDADKPAALATKIEELKTNNHFAVAKGTNSLAIGYEAQTDTSANKSGVFGNSSYISGENSYSIGNSNNIYSNNTVALGNNINTGTGSNYAVAIGDTVFIDSNVSNATVIGYHASASVADSVALGSYSVASRGTDGDAGYDFNTGKASTDITNNAWRPTHAAISIGDDRNVTRQITGVAAGSEDTDAVNVAQLKKTVWNIGLAAEGGKVNNPTADYSLNVGTTVVGNGKNKVQFVAGKGITLTSVPYTTVSTNDTYGIAISTLFENLETNPDNSVTAIVFDGIRYPIASGSTSAPSKVTTDHRALNVDSIQIQKLNDQGNPEVDQDGNPVMEEYRSINSPYIHINGLQDPNDPYKGMYVAPEYQANAAGENAIAIGREADALYTNSIAIGHLAEAGHSDKRAVNTVALGYRAHALANNSVSVGTAAFATGNRSIAIGVSNVVDTETLDHNDQRAWAAGQGSMVLGNEARAVTQAIRFNINNTGNAPIDYSTNDAIALGTRADARALNAIALGGNMSYTDSEGKVTYGSPEGNARDYGATVGEGAKSAIAIGGAYGSQKTDSTGAVTGIKSVTYAAATSYGAKGIAIGSGALIANNEDYLDLQRLIDNPDYQDLKKTYNNTRHAFTVAEREYTNYLASLNGVVPTSGDALEKYNRLKETFETAQSEYNDATGAFTTEIKKKIALEEKNASTVEDAIAIGAGSRTGIIGGIALGSQATAGYLDRSGTESALTGYDMRTETGYFGSESDDPTWKATHGALSIGALSTTNPSSRTDNVTRRITNVAAGVFDRDAVNVAQLKRATTFTSDNRNMAIGSDEQGYSKIQSPFAHFEGVAQMSEAISITEYTRNAYITKVDTEKANINSRITEFQNAIAELDRRLEGDGTTENIGLRAKLRLVPSSNTQLQKNYQQLIKDIEYEKALLSNKITALNKELTNLPSDAGSAYDAAVGLVTQQAHAYGTDSIAIGKGSVVGEMKDNVAVAGKGEQSLAIGVNNTVTGNNSIAIGTKLTVSGNNSGAIGDPSVIDGDNSYSIGNNNTIKGAGSADEIKDVFVLGNHVTINNDEASNSVFLGSNAAYVPADYTSTGGTTAGNTAYNSMIINDRTYDFAGGDRTAGVVSVGGGTVEGKVITRRIQNVAPGLISAESTDAINGSQLYQAMQALSIEVKADEAKSTKVDVTNNPAPDTTGGGTTGGTTTGGDTSGGTAGGTTGGTTTADTPSITLTPAITYEVKASTTELVLGDDADGKTSTQRNLLLKDLKKDEADNDPKSYKYQLDLKKDIDLGKDGSVTTGDTVMNNDGLTVGDTTVARDRVMVGDTTMNNDGVSIAGGPSMTKEGIAAGGKKITNVAPGEADTDALNVGQLRDYAAANNAAMNNLGNQITGVEHRMKKGLAGAAALAALHPLDFDPDDKLTFAAGMGHYRGETAAAIGAFYRPDEKVMFSVGGSMGNGENMINAGVSFSLDRTPRVTGSRTALTKEVVQLRAQVAKQDAQIAKQDQQLAMQGAQIAQLTALVSQLTGAPVAMPAIPQVQAALSPLFPDNLDNKWAYDSLEDLEQRGYIRGYAGRSLTRDEFAAALDRAMAGGAKLDERLIQEFEPELSHVRVAHVEGHGNNEGEWYERPRASHDKLEDKHEIEKKHFRVKEKKVTSKS